MMTLLGGVEPSDPAATMISASVFGFHVVGSQEALAHMCVLLSMENVPDRTIVPMPSYVPDVVLTIALPSMNTVPSIVSVLVVWFHAICPPGVVQLYDRPDGVRSCRGVVLLRVTSVSNTGTVPLEEAHGNHGPGGAERCQKFIWTGVSAGVFVRRVDGIAVPLWVAKMLFPWAQLHGTS